MRKYLINLLVLLCLTSQVRSQSINTQPYVPDGGGSVSANTINIVPPVGYPPYLPSGSWYVNSTTSGGLVAQPRISYFLEYGDGGFTTFESKTYTYRSMTPQVALLTMRGKYDTIHPHGSITAFTINPSVANTSATQQLLPAGKNIALISDVIDLISNDTIQTVITYKKTFSGTGKILFYYNAGMQAFNGIDLSANSKVQPLNYAPGTTLSAVRTYLQTPNPDLSYSNPTQVAGHYVLSSDPATRAIKYINTNNLTAGTSNVLVFELPAGNNSDEHNIFITLVTKGNEIYRSALSSTMLNAYIIPDSLNISLDPMVNKGQLYPISASLEFPIAQPDPKGSNPGMVVPHDPNYIIADKKCTYACFPGQPAQPFKFHVHFQNDGVGFAKKIEVSVFLHNKLDISTFTAGLANVAGKEIKGGNLQVKVLPYPGVGDWNKVVFTLFTTKPVDGYVNLFGTKMVSCPETDLRTMGDVYFSIKSVSGSVPSYFSIASIVFDTQAPVVTRMNRISCCEKMGTPDIIPERPFGKKGKITMEGPPKLIDKKRNALNLRSNG